MKSSRNKTIDFDAADGAHYLERCLHVSGTPRIQDILDRTICGDLFEIISCLPGAFADLMIADPPYNLDKQYGDTAFHRLAAEEYRTFTRR